MYVLVSAGVLGGQREHQIALELELQEIVSCLAMGAGNQTPVLQEDSMCS